MAVKFHHTVLTGSRVWFCEKDITDRLYDGLSITPNKGPTVADLTPSRFCSSMSFSLDFIAVLTDL